MAKKIVNIRLRPDRQLGIRVFHACVGRWPHQFCSHLRNRRHGVGKR
jgi:hypothetical protein